jgi:3-oxoacid CoA-transferase
MHRTHAEFFAMSDKVYPDAKSALDGLLHDNMTIAAGGFGLCGIPENLIAALHEERREGADHCGQQRGGGRLRDGRIAAGASGKKSDGSYVGENKEFERQV